MGPCRWPGLVGVVSRGCIFIWSNKKTAPHPTWDKSCTPAIPPKLTFWKTSARFTRHHACPMDNGWVPVGIYLVSRSSRPRKSIHLAAPRPDLTTQDSLIRLSAALPPEHRRPLCGVGLLCRLLFFLKGLLLFHCWSHYSGFAPICQPLFFNSLKKRLGGTLPMCLPWFHLFQRSVMALFFK